MSRLRTVDDGTSTTTFLYDGQDMIAEYDGTTVTKRYVHGAGVDEPLVEYTGSGTSNKVWLVPDVRGSIVAHASASGVSLATNRYDPYGQPQGSNTGRFQYTGQVWLEELGLYYYKARFYNPNLRRFLTADPIGYGDGMNMYTYVSGDPVNMTDPSGLYGAGINGQITDEIIVTGTRHSRGDVDWGGYFNGMNFGFSTPQVNQFAFALERNGSVINVSVPGSVKKELCPVGKLFNGRPNGGYESFDVGRKDPSSSIKFFGIRPRIVTGPYGTFNQTVIIAQGRLERYTQDGFLAGGVRILQGSRGYYFQSTPSVPRGGLSQGSNNDTSVWRGQVGALNSLGDWNFLGTDLYLENVSRTYNSVLNRGELRNVICDTKG